MKPELVPVMTPGVRYMVVYRRQTHTLPLVAVLDHIAVEHGSLVMSGRPIIGTQHIPLDWVRAIDEVPKSTPVAVNGRPVGKWAHLVRQPSDETRLAERHYEVENGGL